MDHKQVKCKPLDFQIQEPEMAFSKSKTSQHCPSEIFMKMKFKLTNRFPASVFQTHGPREEAVSSF